MAIGINRNYRPRTYSVKVGEMWARQQWCRDMFGKEKEFQTWWRHKGQLHFRNEQDYLLFMLKWY